MKYIPLDAVLAEIEKRKHRNLLNEGAFEEDVDILSFLKTLEVREVNLTWKDIDLILDITDQIANDDSMEEKLKNMSQEEYCTEVLKRFNAQIGKHSWNEKMKQMAIKAVNSPEAQSCIKSWGIDPNDVIKWIENKNEQSYECVNDPEVPQDYDFNIGDWVFIEEINGFKQGPLQIKDINGCGYSFDNYHIIPFCYKNIFSRWTIKDAKPGDILSWDHERYTIIFKEYKDSKIIAYCSYNSHDDHFGTSTKYVTEFEDLGFQPASEHAKELLLNKIKENNYEWDPYKLTLSTTAAINCTESCVVGDIKPGKLSMSLKSFIENFSHNNEVWIENKNNFCMYHKYYPEDDKHDCTVMDWMMQYSDIADCNVIRISNVIHSIVVNTDKTEFTFLPELVTLDNSPVWFYDKVHQTKTEVHCDA